MSNYKITQYSRDRMKELNDKLETDVFSIRVSTDPKKKIDVFLRTDKIASVGDPELGDYPTFIGEKGIEFANKRRDAFYNRFKRLPDIKNGEITPMFWSRWLLW